MAEIVLGNHEVLQRSAVTCRIRMNIKKHRIRKHPSEELALLWNSYWGLGTGYYFRPERLQPHCTATTGPVNQSNPLSHEKALEGINPKQIIQKKKISSLLSPREAFIPSLTPGMERLVSDAYKWVNSRYD